MGICGSLMDIFDYPQARSANKYCFTKLDLTDYYIYLILRSTCTTLLRQERRHLDNKKRKFLTFVLLLCSVCTIFAH